MATWTVLSRTNDDQGETTTWLVDLDALQEPEHDDDRAQGDDRDHERRE